VANILTLLMRPLHKQERPDSNLPVRYRMQTGADRISRPPLDMKNTACFFDTVFYVFMVNLIKKACYR